MLSRPAAAEPRYTHVDLEAAQQQMLTQINLIRAAHGLTLLQEDPAVSQVARHYARDMVLNDFFAHISPNGDGPQERLSEAGMPWPVGENLGVMRSYGLSTSEIVAGLLDALMHSPPHRANLLDPRATHLGLGFAQDKDDQTNFMDLTVDGRPSAGTVIVVQEFVRKPLKRWASEGMSRMMKPRESVTLSGEPTASFASVAVEVIDMNTRELVRYQHLPLVGGSFSTDLRLDHPGKYEVRVLGLQAGALVQSPEPLGVFMYTVEGPALPATTAGDPVF